MFLPINFIIFNIRVFDNSHRSSSENNGSQSSFRFTFDNFVFNSIGYTSFNRVYESGTYPYGLSS